MTPEEREALEDVVACLLDLLKPNEPPRHYVVSAAELLGMPIPNANGTSDGEDNA